MKRLYNHSKLMRASFCLLFALLSGLAASARGNG